jgi:hypothetical protein
VRGGQWLRIDTNRGRRIGGNGARREPVRVCQAPAEPLIRVQPAGIETSFPAEGKPEEDVRRDVVTSVTLQAQRRELLCLPCSKRVRPFARQGVSVEPIGEGVIGVNAGQARTS